MGDRGEEATGAGRGLVGRAAEFRLVRDFLEESFTTGSTLLLSGQAGVGKTVLLEAAAESASAAGARLLRGVAVEFEADIGFAGLNQVLLPMTNELDRLEAPHREALGAALGFGTESPTDRTAVSRAALQLLLQASADQPVLVILDDLHWMDRSSAAVFAFIASHVNGTRIGIMGATRSGVDGFFDRRTLREHQLLPLEEDAAAVLVGKRYPLLAATVRRRVLSEAQGNPLALLELPAALSGSERAALQALPAVLPLTRRLHTVFASRVRALPADSVQLLLLAAFEGSGDLRVLIDASESMGGLGSSNRPKTRS